MICGIYMLYNTINRKSYIGRSTDIYRRIKQHTSSAKNYTGNPYNRLYEAVKVHGFEQFTTHIVEECGIENLNSREVYYINLYDSFNSGYNMTTGGNEFQLGEYNFQSKLTGNQVTEIKSLLRKNDKNILEISKMFDNTSRSMVTAINLGTRWSHIGDHIYPIRDNTQQGLYCKNCGNKITFNHELCVKCSNIKTSMKTRGDNNYNSRITEEEVKEIKFLLKNSSVSVIEITHNYKIQLPLQYTL